MRYTESHFGLEGYPENKISGDGGRTRESLPFTPEKFREWLENIEHWLDRELDGEELRDLKEILLW